METQKFIVTSKRNDYLYAYHTEYEVGDDNDRDLLAACNIKRFGLQEQNLLFNKKPLAHGGSDVEVPTMDDRQEIDLKSSVPVKRQYVQV